MEIDTIGLVSKYPTIVVNPVIKLPSVCFLVDFRAEEPRNLMLDDLKNCGRVNDHKVDVYARCGISAGRTVGCRSGKSYLSVETGGRNTDNSHVIVHFNFAVYVKFAVLSITGDVALQIA